MSIEIGEKVEESIKAEQEIDFDRQNYTSVAFRGSLLFFNIVDLSNIDPMYQYSLQWFTDLFGIGLEQAPQHTDLSIRLENLNRYITQLIYENVSRSLFERHKLLFSFMLTAKILFGDKSLDDEEWRFLLAGSAMDVKVPPNPTKWLNEIQ